MEQQDHFAEGQEALYREEPDYEAAEASFRLAVSSYTDTGNAFHYLGLTIQQQERFDEAAEMYRKAIALLPNDPRPRMALASCMEQAGNWRQAALLVEEGLALHPSYCEADSRLMLADLYEELGQDAKAMEQLTIVAAMEPSYPSYEQPIEEAKNRLQNKQ